MRNGFSLTTFTGTAWWETNQRGIYVMLMFAGVEGWFINVILSFAEEIFETVLIIAKGPHVFGIIYGEICRFET